jgi:hypothetical protein
MQGSARVWAHWVVAWGVSAWVLWLLYQEYKIYASLRQRALLDAARPQVGRDDHNSSDWGQAT